MGLSAEKKTSDRVQGAKQNQAGHLAESRIAAGFPSPAAEYTEGPLDLNQLLVQHREATFFVRVEGDSMKGAGIASGDLLVVDRALEARNGSIVIATIDGDFLVKKLRKKRNGEAWLESANPEFPPLKLEEGSDFQIWGVVSHSIRSFE